MRPDGASLVPAQAVTAPGETFEERVARRAPRCSGRSRSPPRSRCEAAGLDVATTPRGVLVEAVAIDVPAAKALASGDVIVAVGGRKVSTVAQLLHATRPSARGEGSASGCGASEGHRAHRPDRRRAGRPEARDHRDPRLAGREDRAAARRRHRPRRRRRPVGGAALRAPGLPGAGPRRRPRAPGRGDRRDRARRQRRAGRGHQAEDVRRALGRGGRVPRAGWGKRGHGTAVCRGLARDPCGEFSTGVARPANASSEIAFAGILPGGRQPQNAGISSRRGLRVPRAAGHNARCPSGDFGAGEQRGYEQASVRDMRGLLFPS